MTCPCCNGAKAIRGLGCPGAKVIEIPCPDCKGTGVVDKNWRSVGRKIRALRQEHDLALSEAAKRLGIRPHALSEAERGMCDPEPVLKALRLELAR